MEEENLGSSNEELSPEQEPDSNQAETSDNTTKPKSDSPDNTSAEGDGSEKSNVKPPSTEDIEEKKPKRKKKSKKKKKKKSKKDKDSGAEKDSSTVKDAGAEKDPSTVKDSGSEEDSFSEEDSNSEEDSSSEEDSDPQEDSLNTPPSDDVGKISPSTDSDKKESLDPQEDSQNTPPSDDVGKISPSTDSDKKESLDPQDKAENDPESELPVEEKQGLIPGTDSQKGDSKESQPSTSFGTSDKGGLESLPQMDMEKDPDFKKRPSLTSPGSEELKSQSSLEALTSGGSSKKITSTQSSFDSEKASDDTQATVESFKTDENSAASGAQPADTSEGKQMVSPEGSSTTGSLVTHDDGGAKFIFKDKSFVKGVNPGDMPPEPPTYSGSGGSPSDPPSYPPELPPSLSSSSTLSGYIPDVPPPGYFENQREELDDERERRQEGVNLNVWMSSVDSSRVNTSVLVEQDPPEERIESGPRRTPPPPWTIAWFRFQLKKRLCMCCIILGILGCIAFVAFVLVRYGLSLKPSEKGSGGKEPPGDSGDKKNSTLVD